MVATQPRLNRIFSNTHVLALWYSVYAMHCFFGIPYSDNLICPGRQKPLAASDLHPTHTRTFQCADAEFDLDQLS